MMNRLVIGIDADDTAVDMQETLQRWHNRMYGTCLSAASIKNYALRNAWNCSQEEEHRRIHEFYQSEDFRGMEPMAGALEIIPLLARDSGIVGITSRPRIVLEETVGWFSRYFPGIFREVYFASGYLFGERAKTKAQICLENGVGVLIDDCVRHVVECRNAGVKAILFGDFGWNQTDELPRDVRARTWQEVLEKLDGIN